MCDCFKVVKVGDESFLKFHNKTLNIKTIVSVKEEFNNIREDVRDTHGRWLKSKVVGIEKCIKINTSQRSADYEYCIDKTSDSINYAFLKKLFAL